MATAISSLRPMSTTLYRPNIRSVRHGSGRSGKAEGGTDVQQVYGAFRRAGHGSGFDAYFGTLYSKDLPGRIVDAYTAYLHALGRTSEEVIGRKEADLFPAAVAAESAARDQIVLLTGQPLEVEAAVVMGGRPRALFVCSSPW